MKRTSKLTFKNLGRFPLAAVALALALFCVLGTTNASAGSVPIDPAWYAPSSGMNLITTYPNEDLGDVFRSNVSGNVNALGIYAGNGSPFNPETVGLYNAAGVLLTSAIVTDTDPIINGYYWSSLLSNPASVTAGAQYTVVDFVNGNAWSWGGNVPINNWATYLYNDYADASSLQFTTSIPSGSSNVAYYGGNVSVTPEPGTLLLLGTGLMGFGGLLRRKFGRKNA
jgi:hypothetical protein